MTALEKSAQAAVDIDGGSTEKTDMPHPLPARDSCTPLFEVDRVSKLRADSFRPVPSVPGLLVHTIAAAEKYSEGKAIARLFRMDPATPFEAPSAFTQFRGIKFAYVLNGWACFDIEGLGETRLEAGTLACLPPNNRHRMVDASPDFEDIEYELPFLTATLAKTWPAGGASCASPSMIIPLTPESFQAIPSFLGGVDRKFPIVREMTGGAVNVSMLKANPPHVWDGTPWHIHHNNFYCALRTKGSGTMQYEGAGKVILESGDFLIQQGGVRHREVIMSLDYETFVIDLPGAYPTTVFLCDEETGAYTSRMFTTAQESAEAMG